MDSETKKNIVRGMIQHEDTLLNHRLNWMLALQGLLVAALGMFWETVPPASWLIIGFGVVSSLSFWYSLAISHKSIEALKQRWQEQVSDDSEDWPPVQSYSRCRTVFMPWRLLPPLVLVLWVALGLIMTGVCNRIS